MYPELFIAQVVYPSSAADESLRIIIQQPFDSVTLQTQRTYSSFNHVRSRWQQVSIKPAHYLLVAWHSGRTSIEFDKRTFAVLRSTSTWRVTTYVDKPSAVGQPTRQTKLYILSG